ncbi:hypothetical protein ES705_49477 [subsurface metagenome]
MNIDNHFTTIQDYLDMAYFKLAALDHDSALAALAKVYSQTRNLIDEVYVMKTESESVERPTGD